MNPFEAENQSNLQDISFVDHRIESLKKELEFMKKQSCMLRGVEYVAPQKSCAPTAPIISRERDEAIGTYTQCETFTIELKDCTFSNELFTYLKEKIGGNNGLING